MRVYLESYGCAQNRGEGSEIARELARAGHVLVPGPGDAEAGVLVTCAVIGSTEARMVRRWRALSETVPRVIVTGCLVPLRSEMLRGPGRDRTTLVPIREQHRIPALLETGADPAGARARSPLVASGPVGAIAPAPPVAEEIVIAQGCTSGCSYCFSRLARGRLASVPPDEVARRVRAAVARGASELRLTSLDTAAWGADRDGGARLPELLGAVAAVDGDFSVRVGMMSPQTLAPILPRYLDSLRPDRFYRFLHLPLQSGSDRILLAMRRGYAVRDFARAVDAARARFPELMLSTDVIVGFPGESEEDHRATVAALRAAGPETVNVTRFSPRPGTVAARLTPVAPDVTKRRSREFATLRTELGRGRLERWIGREELARVSEYGPGSSAVARLPNYLPVVLDGRPPLGSTLRVRVDGARSTYLLGRPAHGPF